MAQKQTTIPEQRNSSLITVKYLRILTFKVLLNNHIFGWQILIERHPHLPVYSSAYEYTLIYVSVSYVYVVFYVVCKL